MQVIICVVLVSHFKVMMMAHFIQRMLKLENTWKKKRATKPKTLKTNQKRFSRTQCKPLPRLPTVPFNAVKLIPILNSTVLYPSTTTP